MADVATINSDDDLGWQNRLRAFDVNGDGDVTAADVLIVINSINHFGVSAADVGEAAGDASMVAWFRF